MIGERWQNARGDTVTVTPTGLTVAHNTRQTPRPKVRQAMQAGDPFGGREVVGLALSPRTPDGRGGEVHKIVRTGPPVQATFADPVPYFKLNDRRRAELEAEAEALAAKIAAPGLDLVVRDKLKQDLKKITDELGMDRNAPPVRSSSMPGRGYDRATGA